MMGFLTPRQVSGLGMVDGFEFRDELNSYSNSLYHHDAMKSMVATIHSFVNL